MDNPTKKHIPLTRIQKLIGERMLKSKRSKPCFYIESKADITEFMAMRPKLRKSLGVKITTNAFYVHTLALAVKKYPLTAGRLENGHMKIAERINVGFAVNAPQGLVVPVVKNAAEKTLPQIAAEEQSLTNKARDNQLTLEDIENETVALSNLGIYGIDRFLGIVPPPATTILAVGNVVPSIVCENEELNVRKIVSLSLAADRRVLDETYAAEFLNFITEQLENPNNIVKAEERQVTLCQKQR